MKFSSLQAAVGNYIKENWNPLDWFDIPIGNPLSFSQPRGGPRDKPLGSTLGNQTPAPSSASAAPPPMKIPAPDTSALLAGLAAAAAAVALFPVTIAPSFAAAAGEASSAFSAIGSNAQELTPVLASAAQTAGGAFHQGIAGGGQRAVGAAEEAGAGVHSALTNIPSPYSEAVSLGAALGQGVADGAASMAEAAAAAAAGVVRAAINAAKAEGEIASPSKRADREIGRPIPLGVAEGIWASAGVPIAAMKGVIDQVLGLNTASMLSRANPNAGRIAGGHTTNITVIALRSEEWLGVLRRSELGERAFNFNDEFARANGV